jgi:hypothetical protein
LFARKQQKIINHSGKLVLKDELNFSKFWLSSVCCHLAHCSDVVPLALDGKNLRLYLITQTPEILIKILGKSV